MLDENKQFRNYDLMVIFKKLKKKGLINPFGEHEVFLFWLPV
jgi:hypothetical protein